MSECQRFPEIDQEGYLDSEIKFLFLKYRLSLFKTDVFKKILRRYSAFSIKCIGLIALLYTKNNSEINHKVKRKCV